MLRLTASFLSLPIPCFTRLGSPIALGAASLALGTLGLSSPSAHSQTYTLTTLATFTGTGNGSRPEGGLLMDSDGSLYGTTAFGGASNFGTVFKITAGTNTVTTLTTFNNTNGSSPAGGLIRDSSGNLYGTTETGGANNYGTVFKITTGTNSLSTLATFTGSGNGSYPIAGLTMDGNGNLYGTTYNGGTNSAGTVFKIAAGTSNLTTLATFTGPGSGSNTSNGASPYGGLILDSSGNLYGTTSAGGSNNRGTVFKIAAGTNTLTTIVSFNGSNGFAPYSGVILDASGNLYGTTYNGGANGIGTVFKIAAGTSTVTTLATFNGGGVGSNGSYPEANLILDSSGNLYGTTSQGGANSKGTVFKVAAGTTTLTTIATFFGINGESPDAGLILDKSGNLFGTTSLGGSSNAGTVFKLTPLAASAPEPVTFALFLPGGVLGVVAARRRRARLQLSTPK